MDKWFGSMRADPAGPPAPDDRRHPGRHLDPEGAGRRLRLGRGQVEGGPGGGRRQGRRIPTPRRRALGRGHAGRGDAARGRSRARHRRLGPTRDVDPSGAGGSAGRLGTCPPRCSKSSRRPRPGSGSAASSRRASTPRCCWRTASGSGGSTSTSSTTVRCRTTSSRGCGASSRSAAKGIPVAYLTGVREFYALPFAVTRDVLVPRPETEGLVEVALEALRPLPAPRFVDVGTGSGCIAVAVLHALPAASGIATDLSAAALAVATANAARHGVTARFTAMEGSLLGAAPGHGRLRSTRRRAVEPALRRAGRPDRSRPASPRTSRRSRSTSPAPTPSSSRGARPRGARGARSGRPPRDRDRRRQRAGRARRCSGGSATSTCACAPTARASRGSRRDAGRRRGGGRRRRKRTGPRKAPSAAPGPRRLEWIGSVPSGGDPVRYRIEKSSVTASTTAR